MKVKKDVLSLQLWKHQAALRIKTAYTSIVLLCNVTNIAWRLSLLNFQVKHRTIRQCLNWYISKTMYDIWKTINSPVASDPRKFIMVIPHDFLKAKETNIPLPCKMARNTKFLGLQSGTQITKVLLLHLEMQMFLCAGK